MTDPLDDDRVLDRFRRWLAEARAEAAADPGPPPTGEPEVGLYRLAEEFSALRHEVKLQTKGTRGLREQAEALLRGLDRAIDQFRAVAPREEQAARSAARPLAEALADLDEALDRGHAEVERARRRLDDPASRPLVAELDALYARQPWWRRPWLRPYHDRARELALRPRAPGLLDALREGYELIRARLRRALEAEEIDRIDTVGRPVDPGRMAVVAVTDSTPGGPPPGHVVDEIRRGYTWRGQVLRYAEVRAARAAGPIAARGEAPDPGPEND